MASPLTIKHDDAAERQALYDSFGLVGAARTAPQLVVDGVRIGGYADAIRAGFPASSDIRFDSDF